MTVLLPTPYAPLQKGRTMTRTTSRRGRLAIVTGLAALLALSLLGPVGASSHREAPLITEDPVADNTDLYAFVSPDAPDTVTLIANWIPFQEPAGGPNFYNFGEDVLYEVNIDNDGDAVEDVTYEWRFTSTFTNPNTFLYNTNTIDSLDDADWNYRQTYTLSVVKDGVRTVLGAGLPVPPNNVGPRSTPNYDALADAAIVELGNGITSFAGQRDEAFPVDLGSIFDLGGLRPLNEAHLAPLPAEPGKDATAGFNVHSVALQVPTEELVAGDDPVIGVWSSTYRRKTRVFAGGNSATPVHAGPFTQVSRLGMPLVNEVVIPIGLKDTFNTLEPSQDAAALSQPEDDRGVTIPLVQDPELARLIPVLYPAAFPDGAADLPPVPRNDLVAIFLTGIDFADFGAPELGNLNKPANLTLPGEMIRLNTAVPPTPFAEQSRLGLLGGDLDGFPNGRRLIDDVVDIELRALAGGTPLTPSFNVEPNNILGDGVDFNDVELLPTFPYIPAPFDGYSNTHAGPATTSPSNDGA